MSMTGIEMNAVSINMLKKLCIMYNYLLRFDCDIC
jgi:hypothetical protein